ncbi:ABC transporter ATP-binding protein [Nguyenibacter vanlangensis]|uniref:ABC transporter ATP-binding protein n=1 Tax=Nguyenibacter vanlangensis TaxID=1216886 RepID=A0ABZ3CZI6_9PROT
MSGAADAARMDAVLAVSGLTVGYGGQVVLRGIDLVLPPGQWLGLLGANGAGKSTLLRAVSGLVPPLAGQVAIDGVDVLADPVRARRALGYAVDPAALPMVLSGRDYLRLVASAKGLARPDWGRSDWGRPDDWGADDPVVVLDLARWMDVPLETCSLGTRAKFAILAALLGSPRLLILDESLNGLDPLAAWQVRRIIDARVRAGTCSVILATHALESVAAHCSAAIMLEGGAVACRWDAADLAAARRDPAGFGDAVMTLLMARR